MRRLGFGVLLASLVLTAVPDPALAVGVWDPNDPIRRLDIRWVGAVEQPDGRLRVTIVFHERVRLRWFTEPRFGTLSTLAVSFTEDRAQDPFMFGLFGRRGDRLVAAMCESGSSCGGATVRRPDPFTIRARFDRFDVSPRPGWSFRARSWRRSGGVGPLDRTAWGTVI